MLEGDTSQSPLDAVSTIVGWDDDTENHEVI
jgi:hypothetical protein